MIGFLAGGGKEEGDRSLIEELACKRVSATPFELNDRVAVMSKRPLQGPFC